MAEAVTMALGERLGRLEAHKLVEQKCRQALSEGRHLKDEQQQKPRVTAHLSYEELNHLLDPVNYIGVADALIERVLAAALAGN